MKISGKGYLKRLLLAVSNIYVLSLLVVLLILPFLDLNFENYSIELIDKVNNERKIYTYYSDLNGDGTSEVIKYDVRSDEMVAIIIENQTGMLSQINFGGKAASGNRIRFQDFDGDGNKEILVFVLEHKLVSMYVMSPFTRISPWPVHILVKKSFWNRPYRCGISYGDMYDLNNDGCKEFIFSINGFYNPEPRSVYIYDYKTDSVMVSPESGIAKFDVQADDIDNDGEPEIFPNTYALANNLDSVKYWDRCSWFMVYDKNLEYKFPPIQFANYPSNIQVQKHNGNFIILQNYSGVKNFESFMAKYNTKGELISRKVITDRKRFKNSMLKYDFINNKPIVVLRNGEILNVEDKDSLSLVYDRKLKYTNFHGDQLHFKLSDREHCEVVSYIRDQNSIMIAECNYSNASYFRLPERNDGVRFSLYYENHKPFLKVTGKDFTYTIEYRKRHPWINNLFLMVGMFLGVLLLIFFGERLIRYRLNKQYESQRNIAELQIMSVKNQLNPHFTLNLLSSIWSLFSENDKKQAEKVFAQYSKLLRNTVVNSENISTTLEGEIEYVVNYLELEKFRYSEKFNFSIDIADDVDMFVKLPKMMIHTFIENSLKHGIRHLKSGGQIDILIKSENNDIVVEICDNGVGRSKSKEYSGESTGKGLIIIDQMIKHYKMYEKRILSYEIVDLYEDRESIGTKVILKLHYSA